MRSLNKISTLISALFFYLCQSAAWFTICIAVSDTDFGAYPFFMQLLLLIANLLFFWEAITPVKLEGFRGWAVYLVPFLYSFVPAFIAGGVQFAAGVKITLLVLSFISTLAATLIFADKNAKNSLLVFLLCHIAVFLLNIFFVDSSITVGAQVLVCILDSVAIITIDIISMVKAST